MRLAIAGAAAATTLFVSAGVGAFLYSLTVDNDGKITVQGYSEREVNEAIELVRNVAYREGLNDAGPQDVKDAAFAQGREAGWSEGYDAGRDEVLEQICSDLVFASNDTKNALRSLESACNEHWNRQ